MDVIIKTGLERTLSYDPCKKDPHSEFGPGGRGVVVEMLFGQSPFECASFLHGPVGLPL